MCRCRAAAVILPWYPHPGVFTPLWLWWPSKITKIPNVGPLIDYVEKIRVHPGPDLFPGAFGELNPVLLLPFFKAYYFSFFLPHGILRTRVRRCANRFQHDLIKFRRAISQMFFKALCMITSNMLQPLERKKSAGGNIFSVLIIGCPVAAFTGTRGQMKHATTAKCRSMLHHM